MEEKLKTPQERRDYFAGMAMQVVMSETVEMVPASTWDWIKSLLFHYGLTFLKFEMRSVDNVYDQAADRAIKYADAVMRKMDNPVTIDTEGEEVTIKAEPTKSNNVRNLIMVLLFVLGLCAKFIPYFISKYQSSH